MSSPDSSRCPGMRVDVRLCLCLGGLDTIFIAIHLDCSRCGFSPNYVLWDHRLCACSVGQAHPRTLWMYMFRRLFVPTLKTCKLLRSPTARPPPLSSRDVSSASELLAAASRSADTRNPRHCSLWFFLYSVKFTEDGFARVPPLEVQVRDMLNHRLR